MGPVLKLFVIIMLATFFVVGNSFGNLNFSSLGYSKTKLAAKDSVALAFNSDIADNPVEIVLHCQRPKTGQYYVMIYLNGVMSLGSDSKTGYSFYGGGDVEVFHKYSFGSSVLKKGQNRLEIVGGDNLTELFVLEDSYILIYQPFSLTAFIKPYPNLSRLTVMQGGIGYLYYQALDKNGNPVKEINAIYTVNGKSFLSSLTKEDGLLVIPVDTMGSKPGDALNILITDIGSTKLANPISAQLVVTQREYTKEWDIGSSISGTVGVAAGANAYAKLETEGGLSYALDESDVLTVERSAEIGAGGGVGVKTPGAKLTIGAMKAKVGAEAGVEGIVYSTFADTYSFPDRHSREQQMAQSALLIDTAMQIVGKPVPFSTSLVQALMDRVTNYEYYREQESVTLGTLITGSISASAGVKLGSISKNKSSPVIGVSIGGSAEGNIGLGFEYSKYYKQSSFDASGYALNQELGASVEISSLLGAGKPPDDKVTFTGSFTKDYVSGIAGVDYGKSGFAGAFAKFGINNMIKFREEYIADANGNPREFCITIGDNVRTITYTIVGSDINKIKQSIANLSAFIDVANNVNAKVGEKAIADELSKLFGQLANMQIQYTVKEAPTNEFSFPIDLSANLGLDVGASFELKASESLESSVLEGIFLNGKLYPRSSYIDKPKSNAQLKSIVDDAIKGSWEMVKDTFNQVQKMSLLEQSL